MQQVHINRLGVNSIEFDTDTVELPLSPGEERSFEVVLINYGAPTHVNLSVSDALRENITVLEDNPYVKHEEYIPLIARIPYDGRLYTKGQVYITVGYGSKSQGFNLNLGHPGPNEASFSVDVDESLYKPAPSSQKPVSSSKSSKSSRSLSSSMFGDDHWSFQLPSISAEMFSSVFKTISPYTGGILKFIILLLLVALFVSFILSLDLEQFFSFYNSVLYSIMLTFLMAYLLMRLPKSKR